MSTIRKQRGPPLPQQHPLQNRVPPHPLQAPRVLRNPWVSEYVTSSSSSTSALPPRGSSAPAASTSSRPPRPTSSIASSSRVPSRAATLGGPGCCSPGAQLLCYYCLRAALLAALLGGAALAVAGVVLRSHGGRHDLGVLLYIGALAALVSGTLLVVQHRARTHATRRRLRPHLQRTREEEGVPLQHLAAHPQVQTVIPVTPGNWQTSHQTTTLHRSQELEDVRYFMVPPPPLSRPVSVALQAPAMPPAPSESAAVRVVPWWRLGRVPNRQQEAPTTNRPC